MRKDKIVIVMSIFICILAVGIKYYIQNSDTDKLEKANDYTVNMIKENDDKQEVADIDKTDKDTDVVTDDEIKISVSDDIYKEIASQIIPFIVETSDGYESFAAKYSNYISKECMNDIQSIFTDNYYAPYIYRLERTDLEVTNEEGDYPIYDEEYNIKYYGTEEEYIANMTELNIHKVLSIEETEKGTDYITFNVLCSTEFKCLVTLYFENGLVSSYRIDEM